MKSTVLSHHFLDVEVARLIIDGFFFFMVGLEFDHGILNSGILKADAEDDDPNWLLSRVVEELLLELKGFHHDLPSCAQPTDGQAIANAITRVR